MEISIFSFFVNCFVSPQINIYNFSVWEGFHFGSHPFACVCANVFNLSRWGQASLAQL